MFKAFCSLVVSVLVTSVATAQAVPPAPLETEFSITCDVLLLSSNKLALGTSFSSAKPGTAPSGAVAKKDFGDYTVAASLVAASTGLEFEYEPRLTMALFQASKGPIQGQINYATTGDLNVLAVGQTTYLYSQSFIKAEVSGTHYSRIDYNCQATRTK